MGEFLVNHLRAKDINHSDLVIDKGITPTCSIFVDETGERTIVSSGYQKSIWNNFEDIDSYDSLMLDRYSIEFIRSDLVELQKRKNLFISQAGYEHKIDYRLDFLTVSKDEITVNEANDLIDSKTIRYILLTSSNLPARLLSLEGTIEIVPPDFKTINANGAGDTTAAYIAAFGVGDLINNIKKACAAGAIVAGTNDEPTIEKIEEIAKLVEVNPR